MSKIEGSKPYVTYSGKQINGKYCGNKGQAKSYFQEKSDPPIFTNDQNNKSIIFESALIENSETNADNVNSQKSAASEFNDSKSNFEVPKQCAEDGL